MHRNVVGLLAFDFVLRLVLGGVVGVALVIGIAGMDLDDLAPDASGLGIPGHAIADFKLLAHLYSNELRAVAMVASTSTSRASTTGQVIAAGGPMTENSVQATSRASAPASNNLFAAFA
jgi:hypothetical protein